MLDRFTSPIARICLECHLPPLRLQSSLLAAAAMLGFVAVDEAQAQTVGLIGTAPTLAGAGAEAKASYEWALQRFPGRYIPRSELSAPLDDVDVLWWHDSTTDPLPSEAVTAPMVERVKALVRDSGKGLLLTGTTPRYVLALGLEDTAPMGPVREPGVSGNWGFRSVSASPLFAGLPETTLTMSSGLAVDNIVSWWPDAHQFDGQWLAEPEWGGGVVAIGQYHLGKGHVLVISSGAYEWSHPGINTNRSNLEQLTANAFSLLAQPRTSADTIAYWPFDETTGATRTVNVVTGNTNQIRNQFNRPEFTHGVLGRSLRLDGWSTWMQQGATVNTALTGFTVEGWVAVRAYPFDSDAAIVNQHVTPKGFFLGLDTYGRWNFSVGVRQPAGTDEWRAVFAPAPLPKFRWVHIAGVYDAESGLRLYADGRQVAQTSFASQSLSPATNTTLLVGRSNNAATHMGLFSKGAFNGLVDEFRLHSRALNQAEIAALASVGAVPAPDVLPAPDRFATNNTRPIFHPMPPADWTNEPHGMIFWKGRYHVFYQENPNGPYFGNQHWGHIYSDDLVNWTPATNPFWPMPGPDSNGTWSGTTVDLGDQVAALYTSNEGGQSQSVAFSNDDLLIHWNKYTANPVIGTFPPNARHGLQGHRDPHVFRANGFYYAIVGGGYLDTGGTLFLYRSTNLLSWDYRGELFNAPPAQAGTMWEMPYFFPVSQNGWGAETGKWCLLINPLPDPRPIYWIGTFQNERFVPDPDYGSPRRLDVGPHVLSPGVATDPQGRIWSVGVITEDRTTELQATAGWANGFSLPKLLSLDTSRNMLRVRPAPELETLRGTLVSLPAGPRQPGKYPINLRANAFELRLRAEMSAGSAISIEFLASPDASERSVLRYHRNNGTIELDRSASSLAAGVGKWPAVGTVPLETNENLDLRLFVDRSVVEAFINERATFTARVYPTRRDSTMISLQVEGAAVGLNSLEIWPLAGGGLEPGPAWILY